jgi:hypothetical protein
MSLELAKLFFWKKTRFTVVDISMIFQTVINQQAFHWWDLTTGLKNPVYGSLIGGVPFKYWMK